METLIHLITVAIVRLKFALLFCRRLCSLGGKHGHR